MVGPWVYRPDGSATRTLYFNGKKEKYAYLISQQQQMLRDAYIQGAIAGRAITLDRVKQCLEMHFGRRNSDCKTPR